MNSKSYQFVLDDAARVAAAIKLDELKNKRVLLAGANGLLGFYLASLFHYLNEQGWNISADLLTKSPITPASRIFPLSGAQGFTFIQRDLSQPTAYETRYDYVIHSAGYAAPSVFLEDPFNVMDVNYIGLKSMLESCVAANP